MNRNVKEAIKPETGARHKLKSRNVRTVMVDILVQRPKPFLQNLIGNNQKNPAVKSSAAQKPDHLGIFRFDRFDIIVNRSLVIVRGHVVGKFFKAASAKPLSRRRPDGKREDVVGIADRIVDRRPASVEITVGTECSAVRRAIDPVYLLVVKELRCVPLPFHIGKEAVSGSRRLQAGNRQIFEIFAQAIFRRTQVVGHRKDILGLGHNRRNPTEDRRQGIHQDERQRHGDHHLDKGIPPPSFPEGKIVRPPER